MKQHEPYLKICLQLAEKALQEGESPVGAVVVKNGEVIGAGQEKSRQLKDITRHAEVVAIIDALKSMEDLSGAILYTNVEPCLLCSYVIRHHRIAEVVYIKSAGELGGTHKPYDLLTAEDINTWGKPPVVLQLR